MTTKQNLYRVVFGTDTKAGRAFDVVLLWSVLLSVLVVVLESVPDISQNYHDLFYGIEWGFTILFSIEYMIRVWISPKPYKYILSFWGLIDLLSVLPTYLGLFFGGYHYLLVVRIFRLLRIFRILKLVRFSSEANTLIIALKASLYKVTIFFLTVLTFVILLGTLMYVVEGKTNGFTSIPQSIYWAVITITTVGYGDIVPHTVLGKFVSSFIMIIGYAIIAVPTGIVTAEMTRTKEVTKKCTKCQSENNITSSYCSHCGEKV